MKIGIWILAISLIITWLFTMFISSKLSDVSERQGDIEDIVIEMTRWKEYKGKLGGEIK